MSINQARLPHIYKINEARTDTGLESVTATHDPREDKWEQQVRHKLRHASEWLAKRYPSAPESYTSSSGQSVYPRPVATEADVFLLVFKVPVSSLDKLGLVANGLTVNHWPYTVKVTKKDGQDYADVAITLIDHYPNLSDVSSEAPLPAHGDENNPDHYQAVLAGVALETSDLKPRLPSKGAVYGVSHYGVTTELAKDVGQNSAMNRPKFLLDTDVAIDVYQSKAWFKITNGDDLCNPVFSLKLMDRGMKLPDWMMNAQSGGWQTFVNSGLGQDANGRQISRSRFVDARLAVVDKSCIRVDPNWDATFAGIVNASVGNVRVLTAHMASRFAIPEDALK